MAYNWERGLASGARGALGGYYTVLERKSKENMENRKAEAQLQRQKSLAKYQDQLLLDRQQTLKEEERKYNVSQEAMPFYTGEGIQVKRGEYEKMTPEQRGGLQRAEDYKMGLLEKTEKKKASIAQSIADEKLQKDVDNTLGIMGAQLGLEEDQIPTIREFMITEGISKPSQLKAALASTKKSLTPDQLANLKNRAEERATKDLTALDAAPDAEVFGMAESIGWSGSSRDNAMSYLRKNLGEKYADNDLLFVASQTKGTPSLLTKPTSPMREKRVAEAKTGAVRKLIDEVYQGNLSLEEVRMKQPALYERVASGIEALGKNTKVRNVPNIYKPQYSPEEDYTMRGLLGG